ncbi:CaiB/BaiF CoA-transferase family protein [Sphingomonas sp. LaA6.9]|uniref:CaiB/BaiF CoA transferase family protein n=1 Tax=Sphingomonas sp. LaA6.9 TaxID=2919914 RepID=UPI001F4FCAB8|nr:CaiB/BaiF CoA-transferase family protein [Sphingomonas sp. LaA6.9]MCJ8156144.1 CoA transferase [Sphingomonas sp. LaA6.9]
MTTDQHDDQSVRGGGPLAGLRVVEFVGIGPGPHCAMLLADLGADVVRIDREGGNGWENPIVDRGRATVTVDLRSEAGRDYCLGVTDCADVVIEGFRPGVMERLGLGPQVLLERNPRLVFGRITGWGQTGPLAKSAGHDINYIALTGALAAMGRPGEPAQPPLNLVGDFGGGSMLLAFGIMSALWERERSGKGQVIDAAIVDGTSSLMSMFAGLLPRGAISMERESNLLAGSAPYYRCYICADGREISIGPLEPHFYAELLKLIGAPPALHEERLDPARWPEHCVVLAEIFKSRTAAEWTALFDGTDACFAPVVPLHEASEHPHMAERGVFVTHDGLVQVAPVPRFSRTPGAIQPSRDGATAVAAWQETGLARS